MSDKVAEIAESIARFKTKKVFIYKPDYIGTDKSKKLKEISAKFDPGDRDPFIAIYNKNEYDYHYAGMMIVVKPAKSTIVHDLENGQSETIRKGEPVGGIHFMPFNSEKATPRYRTVALAVAYDAMEGFFKLLSEAKTENGEALEMPKWFRGYTNKEMATFAANRAGFLREDPEALETFIIARPDVVKEKVKHEVTSEDLRKLAKRLEQEAERKDLNNEK